MLRVILGLLAIAIANKVYSQCPVSDFEIPSEVCIGENIPITNTSIDATSYQWRFCAGGLDPNPNVNHIDAIGAQDRVFGFTTAYDKQNWYGIATNFEQRKIQLIDFENDLGNPSPTIYDLGNPGNLLKEPYAVAVKLIDSVWYGLVTDLKNNHLIGIKFGPSLNNIESSINLGDLGGLNGPRAIEIVKDGSDVIAVISNMNDNTLTLAKLNFSTTDPMVVIDSLKTPSIPGASQLFGISAVKDCNNWYIFAVSSDGKVFRIDFEDTLFQQPKSYHTLSSAELPLLKTSSIKIRNDGTAYYGILATTTGKFHRISFGEDITRLDPTIEVDIALLDKIIGFDLQEDTNGQWIGLAINFNTRDLFSLNFAKNCTSTTYNSNQKTPLLVSYAEAGQYDISLIALDENENVSVFSKTITVTSSIAPGISYTTDLNRCLNSANTFTGFLSDTSSILTWNWDFGNDSTSSGQQINYQYNAPGEYEVTLEVEAANGCGQRITQPIAIYEPPEPDFLVEASGALCTNGTLNFTNQTDTKGADSIITYNWNFNGEDSTATTHPGVIFTTGGDKTVTLTTAIPGCEVSKDTTFTIFEGPAVDFVFENQCEGESVQFLNQTTGSNITQYQWDFGDGNTFSSTTLSSPEHVFEAPGGYDVSLTVNDAQGCENEVLQTLSSFAKPEASFSAELSCAGTPTLFTDETQIDASANVVLWNWNFGDQTTNAVTKNPEHTFASPGTYAVQLVSATNEGCVDSIIQKIVVETPVQPGFEAIKVCPSEALDVQLNDTSLVTGGEAVTQWLWQVEDVVYQTQNPAHTFDSPGEYTVSLTATASSLCNASVTRTLTVVPLPQADFSFTQACANDVVAFTNMSANPEYIANYQWDFGGVGTATVANPSFTFDDPGTYPVELMIEDIHGCTDTLTQSIEILPQPEAGFTVEETTGAAPFVVSFENTSTDATEYQWAFAGLDTSSAISPSFTFEQAGTYPVQLTVRNTLGCADTLLRTFTVVEPVFDISLNNVTLQPASNGGPGTNIILTVSNTGTLPIQGFYAEVEIDKQLALERSFASTVEPGTTLSFPLGVAFSNINNSEQNTRFVCVTLTPLEDNFVEAKKDDNIFCLNIDESFYSLPPFPNPVQGLVEVPLILPAAEVVDISIATVTGHIMQNYAFSDVRVGLNTLQLDVSPLPTGVYILTIRYQGKLNTYRLVINP